MVRQARVQIVYRPLGGLCAVVVFATLIAPQAAADVQTAAAVHRSTEGYHHTRLGSTGCGTHGMPCPEGHHITTATSHPHRTLSSHDTQHHTITAHTAAAAHHADVTSTQHHTAGQTHQQGSPAEGKKEPGCKDFATAFGEENVQHEDIDVPVGIDPVTGREVEEEDLAEAVIAEEAKKAGMAALEYENNSGVETHSAGAHHPALYNFPSNHAYRLTYTLSIYFTEKAIEAAKWTLGDVYHLTQITSGDNHTLIESFEKAVASAIAPALPDGIADIRAANVALGEPVEVDVVIHPNLLIPEEFNPSQTLLAADKAMHQFEASHFAPWFVQTYGVDEVQVVSAPGNKREMKECAEVFPYEGLPDSQIRGLGQSLAMAVFVWCPLLLAIVATARHGLVVYQRHKRASVLPKGSMKAECDGLKSACGSSGGATPGVANIYAAPAEYYAGPYRTSYSSGGASSCSSHRASSGGGAAHSQPAIASPFKAMAESPCPRESGDDQ